MIYEEKTVIEMMNSPALSAEQRTALKEVLYELNYEKGFYVRKPVMCMDCRSLRTYYDKKTECGGWSPCNGSEVSEAFFCKNAVLRPDLGEMEALAKQLFCDDIPFERRGFASVHECGVVIKTDSKGSAIFAVPNRLSNNTEDGLIDVFRINLNDAQNCMECAERMGNFTAKEAIDIIRGLFAERSGEDAE